MPAGQASAAPADASIAPAAVAAERKKKKVKKKKVDTSNFEFMAVDGGPAADSGNSAAPLVPALAALELSPSAAVFVPGAVAARKLEKKASRERSPRLGASLTTPSSLPSSPSTASTPAFPAGAGGFFVGQAALLVDLVSRPELAGSSVTLVSFDASSLRWAVSLGANGETIRVKAQNLQRSIFVAGAFAPGGAG